MTDTATGNRPTATRRSKTGQRLRIGLVCLSFLVLFVIWHGWIAFREQLAYEQEIAARAAGAGAHAIGTYLQSVRSDLATLSNQEQDLLTGLVVSPDSVELRNSLRILLEMLFPDIRRFAMLDHSGGAGTVLGRVIDVKTRRYVQQYLRGLSTPVRISGVPDRYRLDFLVPLFSHGFHEGYMLLSLRCGQVCSELLENPPSGHRFALRPASAELHAAVEGASMDTGTPSALSRAAGTLSVQAPIPDADWILEDQIEREHLLAGIRQHLIETTLMFGGFVLVALVLYLWAKIKRPVPGQQDQPTQTSAPKLQAAVNASSEGILLTDGKGTIELFNPAAETMFGRLAEDASNSRIDRVIPRFFSKDLAGLFLDAAARERHDVSPIIRETLGVRDGNRDFPVRLSLRQFQFDHEPHFLLLTQDLTLSRQHQTHLALLQQHDVLTGLLNRRQFEQRLEAALSLREIPDTGHVLGMIDVDQFKVINDTCGHEAGDNLLEQLAVLMKSQLPTTETLARLGNDEFGILLHNCSVAEANQICSTLMHAVRSFVFNWGDRTFDVAVSIGLAGIDCECESAAQVMSQADVACHAAKTHGRNRIHVYHPGDAELIRRHGDIYMVPSISHAISEDRFLLIAQPIIPIAPGKSTLPHFEILVRMVDERGNTVIPGEFVPAAERYTLMPAIDRWVVHRLFARQRENLRAWAKQHGDSFLFAVNLSATSLMDHGFLAYLKRQFSNWDVPYQSICFEITETAAISRLDQARRFIEELKSAGCSFALDDFGTGLSSYTYLKELPVDYLKIDGSFVRKMADDPVDHAMVDSINQIGHILGLKTIAEWAEDHHTLNQLRALNVDYAQGYGVGKIIAVDDFELSDIPRALQSHMSKRHDRLVKLPKPGLRPA